MSPCSAATEMSHLGWPERATRLPGYPATRPSLAFGTGEVGIVPLCERARSCRTRHARSEARGPPSGTDGLAAHHLPLVAHPVRDTLRRVPAAVDRHDLLAAGVVALRGAARGPAPDRPSAEHASARIRAALVEELRSIDWAARAEHPRSPVTSLPWLLGRARCHARVGGPGDPAVRGCLGPTTPRCLQRGRRGVAGGGRALHPRPSRWGASSGDLEAQV